LKRPKAKTTSGYSEATAREGSVNSAIGRASALSVVIIALLVLVPPAGAQDVAAFYKDKTVRMIVGSAPGGGYDTYARVVSEHWRKHIPGNPVIIIQNMPGAGSLIATNYLANVAPKDGTVIGAINPIVATEPLLHPDRAKFDVRKLQWIGSALREHHVGVARADTPVKTFADAFQKELIVSGTGGSTNSYPTLTNALLGTKFKVVSGYNGTAQGMLAVERGEVDGNVGITWASVKATQTASLRDGKLRVFVQFGLVKHRELADVPWVFDYAKDAADRAGLRLVLSNQEFGRPFLVPQDTPAFLVAALRKAFTDTMSDPEFLAEAEKRHLDIDPTMGDEIQSLVEEIYTTPEAVVARVKPFLEQSGN
jgi:tripartite-type tricarboxylate transporter receptor subunit TctC